MAGNNKSGLIAIVLVVIGLFLLFSGNIKLQSTIPEFDTRITYFDKPTDMTQFVATNPNDPYFLENDIATAVTHKGGDFRPSDIFIIGGECTSSESLTFKKDFQRLNTFIRWTSIGNSFLNIGNYDFASNVPSLNEYVNYEIKPDNLNIGIYYIFANGEFIRRIDIGNVPLIVSAKGGCGRSEQIRIDYIKYVPIESFTIKNDEVWVTYRIRNTGTTAYSYSYKDIEAQQGLPILGFHSLIEPATIRDLTTQTEVPVPQIYYNLINNKPVPIQPNTIHKIVFRAKFVESMPLLCKGDSSKAVEKQPDGSWACGGFVKETPIIQQCDIAQNGTDCPILKACESQKDLIKCESRIVNNKPKNLCIYDNFEPACKAQLITYQEKVIEIEKTKFVPIPSGTNSFYCFFDSTKTSCDIGEKIISVIPPSNNCVISSDSDIISNSDCFSSKLNFNNKEYHLLNNVEFMADYNIKLLPSISGQIRERQLKSWAILIKGTLPDNFLSIKGKTLGNKFTLQNSNDPMTFVITNNLGFGIDGGYTIQTQNLALEGGVVLRDETKELFLKNGDNDITYNFETKQLGTIIDIIGHFGKVTTDRDYIMKSSENGKEKFLAITKEVVIELPKDIEEVQPKIEIIEKIVEKEVFVEVPAKEDKGIPTPLLIIGGIFGLFVLLKLFKVI